LYGQSVSSFVALAADDFETPVSCAGQLSDFRGVCSHLAHILSSFSLVTTPRFLAGDPVELTLLISSWMPVVLETVISGNYNEIFSDTF
jgi:hypothetical protein